MTENHETTQQQDDLEIQALLKDIPAPRAEAGFYDQALARATLQGARRQRNRWVMAGFGGAIAAGLAVWLIGGMMFNSPQLPDVSNDIPEVTMALAEPRTVNLVFAATEAMNGATLTVSLPAGVELAGFPGQTQIRWETSLSEGRNLLPLKLIALTPAGGELLATLEYEDRNREFRLRVEIS
jgi:anti-sigma factor RsiW